MLPHNLPVIGMICTLKGVECTLYQLIGFRYRGIYTESIDVNKVPTTSHSHISVVLGTIYDIMSNDDWIVPFEYFIDHFEVKG